MLIREAPHCCWPFHCILACQGHAPTWAFFPFTIRLPDATLLTSCLPQPEEKIYLYKNRYLIMLYKIYILKHHLNPYSDCPASLKWCGFFPAMDCYHSAPLHLCLGDFYLSSFPVSNIFQPLTFIVSICYHSHLPKWIAKSLQVETFLH